MKIHQTAWTATAFLIAAGLLVSACGDGGSKAKSSDKDKIGEGSPAKPVTLAVGPMRSTTINANGSNFYRFTTGSAGMYSITASGQFSDIGWTLFSDAGFQDEISVCDDSFLSAEDGGTESCALALNGATAYYLEVDSFEDFADHLYITPTYGGAAGGGVNQGSVGSPVVVTDFASDLTVAANGSTFLSTALVGATNYHIDIDDKGPDHFSDLSWTVFTDSNFTNVLLSCDRRSGTVGEACSFTTASTGNYYVRVDENNPWPVTFDVSVNSGPSYQPDEGTPTTPVVLSLNTSRASNVDGLGTSYYTFDTAAAGSYTVHLTGSFGQIILVFSDNNLTQLVGGKEIDTVSDPGLTLTLNSTTPYYLVVLEEFPNGASYTLDITHP